MKTNTIEDEIARHPFFRGLPPEWLALVAGCGRNARFGADDLLFREGEDATDFFLIREGQVMLEVHAPDRGGLAVQSVGPGEVIGVSWLFPPYRYVLDARATEPVAAIALDGACLRGKCDADSRLGYELMKRFAAVFTERLRAARLRMLDLYA